MHDGFPEEHCSGANAPEPLGACAQRRARCSALLLAPCVMRIAPPLPMLRWRSKARAQWLARVEAAFPPALWKVLSTPFKGAKGFGHYHGVHKRNFFVLFCVFGSGNSPKLAAAISHKGSFYQATFANRNVLAPKKHVCPFFVLFLFSFFSLLF